jgi:hypothetical protein
MTKHTLISGAVTGLPEGAIDRLALFAEWTGTTPPACIVIGEGKDRTFSDDILIYADRQGMSLDWFWLGDERSLVMANHNRERRT